MKRVFRELARNLPNNFQNHEWPIARFHATTTKTNAELQNQGAVVLAPLGALGYISPTIPRGKRAVVPFGGFINIVLSSKLVRSYICMYIYIYIYVYIYI